MLKSGNATVRLTGSASYGRPVGTVEIGGRDLGEAMIAAGLAIPVTGYLKGRPEQARRYMAAYQAARAAKRGAHAGSFTEPAKWRRRRAACLRGEAGAAPTLSAPVPQRPEKSWTSGASEGERARERRTLME